MNTNGSKMAPELMIRLLGLDSIKFSAQGVDRETYAEMRNIDWFDQLYETVATFKELRGDSRTPFIQVSTSTTSEGPEKIEAFRKLFGPVCDQISIGRTTFDFMDLKAVRLSPEERATIKRLAGLDWPKEHPDPCPEVYDKLTVHHDGRVRVCCNDFDGITDLGNVNETPLREIWRHPTIEKYRKHLARHEYEGPLCSVCYSYMEGTA